jgi:predicted RNase H-like HicB family nuclease
MNYKIEIEQEEDGRYIAEIVELPGVLVYGNSQQEATLKVQALALRVLAFLEICTCTNTTSTNSSKIKQKAF